ncbi:hypothetical protein ALC56_02659 [Trachymyrmex septentrionalis]|uniref:Gustatory receptor n=1 Tax=Trachymyrmex septentrionalis TaxID=34720 RepID=A0A195FR05_9HYME|nr:hypothetical protein ALC56_02659 [Trachymyrmex septentrionalis]
MKLFARPKCFSEAIALVTNLSCFLGLRIFEYPHGHPRPILSLTYFLFMFGIHFSGLFNIAKKFYSNIKLMKLEYVLYKTFPYILVVSMILKMLLGWCHTKKFKVCHKKIFEIDKTLRQLGLSVNYDRIYFLTIGIITVWITSNIFELKEYAKIMDIEQQKHIFFSTMIFRRRRRLQSRINVLELKKQDQIVSQIESHFPSRHKNQFQSKLKNQFQRCNPSITKCPERKHLLQIIKQVHLELCKVSKIVCTMLGIQVAWQIAAIIMYLSEVFYSLFIRYVMYQHKVKGVPAHTALALSMSLLCIFEIVSLSRICKNAANEGNKTIEIIHAIYGCNADTDMQEEIQQFGIQILQSPVTFCIFGLTLDNRVLIMIQQFDIQILQSPVTFSAFGLTLDNRVLCMKFKVCYKKIFEIDETLRQLGLSVNYNKIYFVTNGIIIMWITVFLIMKIIVFSHLKKRVDTFTAIHIMLIYMYSLTVNGINVFEFYIFVKCIQMKFKLINQLLCEKLINLSTKEIKLGTFELKDYAKIMNVEQRKHISLKNMIQMHLELCKITKMVCIIFGVQIAWEIGEIILILTGSLYYFYIRYITHQFKVLLEQIILISALSFISILKTIYLSYVCKNTANEANKTIEIIHAIYGCDADTEMQEEIQQFSIQILQSPVTFFVFGVTLDNRILSSVCIKLLHPKEKKKNVVTEVISKQVTKFL